MVFEYDKEKVIEHFNNMSKELQSLSNGVLFEEISDGHKDFKK